MMNGGSRAPGDIRAMMAEMARQNVERVKFFLLRFGMSALAFDALGGGLVKCVCGEADCSGHAIQFEGRVHFTRRGLITIRRPDAVAPGTDDVAAPPMDGEPGAPGEQDDRAVLVKP